MSKAGAREGIRTLDFPLGKQTLDSPLLTPHPRYENVDETAHRFRQSESRFRKTPRCLLAYSIMIVPETTRVDAFVVLVCMTSVALLNGQSCVASVRPTL